MTTVSINKLRLLPYSERLKLIFFQDNWDDEVICLLKDFHDRNHEELEHKLANQFIKTKTATYSKYIKVFSTGKLDINRFCETVLYKNKISFFLFGELVDILVKIKNYEAINKAIDFFEEEYLEIKFIQKEYEDYSCSSLLLIISELSSPEDQKHINFDKIINILFSNINKFNVLRTIKSLRYRLIDKELVQNINDLLNIYDIIT